MTGQELDELLGRAGIRMVEAAQLLQLNRSSLYRWVNGQANVEMRNYAEPIKKAEIIKKAVKAGYLPLIDVKGKQRIGMLRGMMKKIEREERGLTTEGSDW
jgi:hypothetical protein